MALVQPIFQFSSIGTWLENLAIRPSGALLSTRLDAPEVWEITPDTGTGLPLITIPGLNATTGIAELAPDVFAIGAGNYSLDLGAIPQTWGIWLVDLSVSAEPRLVVDMPDVSLVNGVARLDDATLVVADSAAGKVYAVDVPGKSYALKMEGEVFEPPPDGFLPIGVNGVKVLSLHDKTYLYFTNSIRQSLSRVEIDCDANPVGEVETVAEGFVTDDFTLKEDGTAFVVTNVNNTVIRVEPDGEWAVVAGSEDSLEVAGGTACEFGRREEDRDVLYVVTGGAVLFPVNGVSEPAKVVGIHFEG